jgi:hypothetical protein
MAKLTSFATAGLEMFFISLDHLPPHFHVHKPGEWEIRVFFLECTEDHLSFEVKWPPTFQRPPGKVGKNLLKLVLQHRGALLEEWEIKVGKQRGSK